MVVIQPNSEKNTCSLHETCGIVHQFRYECQKKKNKKKNHGNSNRDIWPTANLSTDVILILT